MDGDKFDDILSDVASGVATYKAIRRHKSNYRAFYGHIADDANAREKYARAKADGLDVLADEIIEIADECREGVKLRETKDGTFSERGDMVERSRLQIDARKWLLSKLAPKKYGDQVDVKHSGDLVVKVLRFSDDGSNAPG